MGITIENRFAQKYFREARLIGERNFRRDDSAGEVLILVSFPFVGEDGAFCEVG
jgi:hypothetical protein